MKIGLLDHMGYGNLGDAATQDAVIANIKKRMPNADIVGFSLVPHDTEKRHGIPCHPIRWSHQRPQEITDQASSRIRRNSKFKSVLKNSPLVYPWAKPLTNFVREGMFWVSSYRILRSLDLLVISGGGQLDDLWYGPWSHPFTVFKFALLTRLARKQLYLLNVGVGSLEQPLSKFFARWAVRLAHYRSVRDRDSQERLLKLGVKVAVHVHPDLAYALEVTDCAKSISPLSSKPIVGLNPIGFCDPRIWPRKDASVYQEYLEKISWFSVWLLEHGYNLRIFTTEIGVDRCAVEELKARLSSRLSPPTLINEVLPPPSESVKDVLREISAFDFVVTSKFHGIVFSQLLGKPVISLSYHRKMDFAMRAMNQGQFSADIERFDLDWLSEAFRCLVDESSSIQLASAALVKRNAAILSRQFDSLFLMDKSHLGVNGRTCSSQVAEDGFTKVKVG